MSDKVQLIKQEYRHFNPRKGMYDNIEADTTIRLGGRSFRVYHGDYLLRRSVNKDVEHLVKEGYQPSQIVIVQAPDGGYGLYVEGLQMNKQEEKTAKKQRKQFARDLRITPKTPRLK